MKTAWYTMIFLILICVHSPLSMAQDGQNKATTSGGASFRVEPLWGTQIDPRWKAGEVIGDVEDGITVEFVEFSADGKMLVTGNGEGEAFVLDAADGAIQQHFTYITEEEVSRIDEKRVLGISGGYTKSLEVECGAFTVDGRYVVLGGNLNGIKIFDLSDGSLLRQIKVDEEVDGLSMSTDGRYLAYASYRSAVIMGTDSWERIQDVKYGKDNGGGSVVNSIDFTGDGNLMTVAGNAGAVMLFTTEGWKTIGVGLIPDATSIKSVRFSPGERLIAAGNGGGEITVWRTRDMKMVWQFSSLVYVEAVAWSVDGRYLMAGGRDDGAGRIMVFRTRDWQMVGNPEVMADGASIEYIDVHGDLIAVAGEDGHVRLYRIVNSKI